MHKVYEHDMEKNSTHVHPNTIIITPSKFGIHNKLFGIVLFD